MKYRIQIFVFYIFVFCRSNINLLDQINSVLIVLIKLMDNLKPSYKIHKEPF